MQFRDTVLSGSYILNNAADATAVGDFALATQDGWATLATGTVFAAVQTIAQCSIISKPFFYFFVIIADNYSNY